MIDAGDADAQAFVTAPALCTHCVLQPAARSGNRGDASAEGKPLVVLLHGDAQAASTLASAWTRAVTARGWTLLAVECPRERGCTRGSFWQWDGDPAWVFAQVDAAAARAQFDGRRVHLVGWSGGASWIGMRAQAWGARFASILIHGGGVAPASGDCPTVKPPVYFLVGDQNPYHHLAVGLRDHFERCQHAVTWDLLKGAAHDGEWNALMRAGTADRLLDWMEDKRVPLPPPLPSAAPTASVAPSAASSASTSSPAPTSQGVPPPVAPKPRSGCSMHASGSAGLLPVALALAALAQVARRKGRATSTKRSVASTCAKCDASSSQ